MHPIEAGKRDRGENERHATVSAHMRHKTSAFSCCPSSTTIRTDFRHRRRSRTMHGVRVVDCEGRPVTKISMDEEDGENPRGLTARLAKTKARKNTYGTIRHCVSRGAHSQLLRLANWGMSTYGKSATSDPDVVFIPRANGTLDNEPDLIHP